MNDEQYSKYVKVYEDKPKCLLHAKDGMGNMYFLIKGSSKYYVSIDKVKGFVKCSCPDFSYHGKQEHPKYLCKHCIFVLIFVLGLFKKNELMKHSFFDRGYFNKEEMKKVKKQFEKLGPCQTIKLKSN